MCRDGEFWKRVGSVFCLLALRFSFLTSVLCIAGNCISYSLPFGICGEIWHVVGTDVSLADGSRDEVGLFLPLFSLWVRSQEVVVSFLWLQFLSEGSSFAWSPSFRWAAPVVALVAASGQRQLLGSSGGSL